jgi:hypothetical protein
MKSDSVLWTEFQQLRSASTHAANNITKLHEILKDESKIQEFTDLRTLSRKNARKRVSKQIEENQAFIDEWEEDMDNIAKKLKRGGHDVYAYFLHKTIEEEDSGDMRWKEAAERLLEQRRPCKITENNVTRIVPLGASGYLRRDDDDNVENGAEVEVHVLDDSAAPLEGDETEMRLKIFSDVADSNDKEEPDAVVESDAINVQRFRVPAILARLLKPHQKDAVNQILQRLGVEASGYLLAHSMGLGKTLTTIAVIEALCLQNRKCRVIVACPKSCVFNTWFCEMVHWEDALTFTKYMPVDDDVAFKTNIKSWSKKGGVIIMGHERFRICQETNPLEFECLVFDEGHKLKNPNTNLYKAIDALNVSRKLLLTGSPLQNHLAEYGAMIRLIKSDLFNEVTFKKDFATVIDRGMLADATRLDMSKARTQIEVLTRMTEGIVNRRSSNLLQLALPPMREFKLTYRAPFPVSCESGVFGLTQDTITSSLDEKVTLACALIREIQRQTSDKILVFSWRKDVLYAASTKMPGLVMDGTCTDAQRQNMIESFQNGESNIFYMTTKVGSVGLNLFMANRILILDPAWNPTDDKQACFRAYRYGQTKPVYIYRFIVFNSIEERIYRLAVHKNLAACRIVDERDVERHFTYDQLKNLKDFAEHRLDSSALKSIDPILAPVLPKLVGCSSHDVLFADAEEETLSAEEKADAENQCNYIRSLQECRSVKGSDGVSRTLLSTDIQFEDGSLVPPFAMSSSQMDSHRRKSLIEEFGPKEGAKMKSFNAILPASNEILSHDLEIEGGDINSEIYECQEQNWELTFPHRGSFRLRSRARTIDKVSEWSEWSATIIV